MTRKDKIGIALVLLRRNSSPVFCALLPQVSTHIPALVFSIFTLKTQEETEDEEGAGWNDPSGFHLIPLPFADDIRSAAVEQAATGKSIQLQTLNSEPILIVGVGDISSSVEGAQGRGFQMDPEADYQERLVPS